MPSVVVITGQVLYILLQVQGEDVLTKQTSQQPLAHLQHQHFLEQPSAPNQQWTHRLCSTTLPQESWQDNSLAAYRSLLTEEAGRMLRHASADGTQYPARSLLRTPNHLLPLIEACRTLRGLKSLDISLNALSDAHLPQLQHLAETGVQLTSLDLSCNQFSSQAAASLCSIISHVSHLVRSHGPSQAATQTLSLQAAHSSESAAQATAFVEPPASASQNLDSAARDSNSQDTPSTASTASGGLQSNPIAASTAAEEFTREGGSSSRSAGEPSTSESDTPSGVSNNRFCVQKGFLVSWRSCLWVGFLLAIFDWLSFGPR